LDKIFRALDEILRAATTTPSPAAQKVLECRALKLKLDIAKKGCMNCNPSADVIPELHDDAISADKIEDGVRIMDPAQLVIAVEGCTNQLSKSDADSGVAVGEQLDPQVNNFSPLHRRVTCGDLRLAVCA
jgi:hypothetical protein